MREICVTIRIKTKSVCPICKKQIPAELFEKDGRVYMKKICPTHGEFIERISDLENFKRNLKYLQLLYKYIPTIDVPQCPFKCEQCNLHRSPTVLGIIDVTNRCNLRCSYCFANAAVSGRLYEPDIDTIKKQIDYLVNQNPPAPAVMFSGGEPTMRGDFLEIVRYAVHEKGLYTLVATNGYKIASSLEYAKKLAEAGPVVLYLSFDGLTDETNREKKNHLIIDKILENARKTGLSIVLVPTIIKGVNENQIWPIIKFAFENMDVVRGVNFQPVSFCGRMSKEKREKQRFTISDLKHTLSQQSDGVIKPQHWFPVPSVLPLIELYEEITGNRAVTFSTHPLCGEATYLIKDDKGNPVPLTAFIDIDKFIELIEKYNKEIKKDNSFKEMKLLALTKDLLQQATKIHDLPLNFRYKFAKLLKNIIFNPGNLKALSDFHFETLFIGTMHFQDLYNLDVERLKYCVIHYITPDLKRIPFCAYNGDLGYREKIEKHHSEPFYDK